MTNISNIERVRHKFVGEKFHVFFGMRHGSRQKNI